MTRAIKKGDPNCNHEWVYDSKVIATNPPIHPKICGKCGRVEEEAGAYCDVAKFDRLYKKFHEGG